MRDHRITARVLVVEDERDIREGIAEFLEGEGYAVGTASDGAEGIRVAQTFAPDLVLLDLAMPVVDGFRFLELWRADPATSGVPVVVLTACQGVELAGCDVLAKPFDLEDLLALAHAHTNDLRARPPAA